VYLVEAGLRNFGFFDPASSLRSLHGSPSLTRLM